MPKHPLPEDFAVTPSMRGWAAEHVQREDLSPIEWVEAIAEMVDTDCHQRR
jgi:hypothetical protein